MNEYAYPFEREVATEPPALYARLQRDEPVAPVTMPTGDPAFVVTRYDDTKLVLSDLRFSSNRNRPGAPRPVAMARDDSMVGMDPPDHTRLRRLVSRAFTARRVAALRPAITETVEQLLTAMERQGPPADIVPAIAAPLPVSVICDLLGVPFADRATLRDLSARLVSYTAFSMAEMAAARGQLRAFIADLVQIRRADPGDDVLSAMIRARDEEDKLSESELVSQAMLMLVAGHETTVNQIASSVATLLAHPDQLALLRADPAAAETGVEELLRHHPPGDSGQFRLALEDVELSGTRIPAGSAVLACIPVANRDPRQFPDPDRLDLRRTDNQHLSLGHGAHFCLGAALVRAELSILLPRLFGRFPALRLAIPAEQLQWQRGLRISGYAQVPVSW
jgi:cytochrome P450